MRVAVVDDVAGSLPGAAGTEIEALSLDVASQLRVVGFGRGAVAIRQSSGGNREGNVEEDGVVPARFEGIAVQEESLHDGHRADRCLFAARG